MLKKWCIYVSLFCAAMLAATPALCTELEPGDGYKTELIASGAPLEYAGGMAITADQTRMYICNKTTDANGQYGNLVELDLTTKTMAELYPARTEGAPNDILMGNGSELTGYDLIMSFQNLDPNGCCDGQVTRMSLDDLSVTLLAKNPRFGGNPSDMAFGPGGDWPDGIYYLDWGWSAIGMESALLYIPGMGQVEIYADDPDVMPYTENVQNMAFDMAGIFDPTGMGNPGLLLFAYPDPDYGDGLHKVYYVDYLGNISLVYTLPETQYIHAGVFGPGNEFFGNDLYVYGNLGNSGFGIHRIGADMQSRLVAKLVNPQSSRGGEKLVFSPDGNKLYFCYADNVFAISQAPPMCDCTDTDADGVIDAWDACPDTPEGAYTNANGCPREDTTTLSLSSVDILKTKNRDSGMLGITGSVVLPDPPSGMTSVPARVRVELLGYDSGSDLVATKDTTLSVRKLGRNVLLHQ